MKNLKATVALVAILAPLATFSPQAALAQDRHRGGPPDQSGDAGAAQAPAPQAERHRMGPGGQQPQAPQGPQGPQGQYQGRFNGGGQYGGRQGPTATPQGPQPQAQAQPQVQNRQDRGGYQGGRYGGGYQSAPQAQAQPPVQQYQGRPDRGGYDNRGGDYRNRGGAQGFAPGVNEGRAYDRGGYDNRAPGYRGDTYRGDNRFQGDNRYRGGGYNRAGGQQFAYRGREYFRFRSDPYVWPRGYSVRSWGVRQILPSFFLMDRYYIDDFWNYGFDEPPYGCRWVRVGDDALLVNVYSGQIVDVVPGVFYY